jgi:predicted nucleic acid-binding protein
MKPLIVGASVVMKWYFHEPFSDECLRLSGGSVMLAAPDLIYPQIGGALVKRVRAGEIKRDEAHRILANLRRLPIRAVSADELAPAALEIATVTARTFTESLYFALAMREQTTLVTADRWWFSLLSTGPMKRYLTWVGDL